MHMPSVLALDVDTHWREGRVYAGRTRRLVWALGCYQWQVLLKAVADRRHFPIVEVHFLLRPHYGQQPSDASNRAPTKREQPRHPLGYNKPNAEETRTALPSYRVHPSSQHTSLVLFARCNRIRAPPFVRAHLRVPEPRNRGTIQ